MIKNFYYFGIYGNRFLWFHLYAGSVGYWWARNIGLSLIDSVLIIFALAVVWGLIEYFIESFGKPERLVQIYGSLRRWGYDTAGDIIMPLMLGSIFWWRF